MIMHNIFKIALMLTIGNAKNNMDTILQYSILTTIASFIMLIIVAFFFNKPNLPNIIKVIFYLISLVCGWALMVALVRGTYLAIINLFQ